MLEQLLGEILSVIGQGVVAYLVIGAVLAIPLYILGRLMALGTWLRVWYLRRHPPTTRDWYRMSPEVLAAYTQYLRTR